MPVFTAFVAPLASARPHAAPGTTTCTRRAVLPALALSAAALWLPPARADELSEATDAKAKVSGEVPLSEFVAMLRANQIKAVWFYGSFADYCCFVDKGGVFRHVGEGYPVESPRSPESPKQIMAKLREAQVPFYQAPPVDIRFLRKET